MQTERDASCPCGSGKKYKKCCLTKDVTEHFPKPVDGAYSEFQRLGSQIHFKLMDAFQELPGQQVEISFREFLSNPLIDANDLVAFQRSQAFRDRVPHLLQFLILNALRMPNGMVLHEFGVESMANGFDSDELSVLGRLRKGVLGVFQIEDLFPETHRVRVRDVLRERVILVHDVKLSKSGPRYLMLLGKVVYLPEIEAHILYTLSPFAIDPEQKQDCMEQLRRCAGLLSSAEADGRDWLEVLNSNPMAFYWLDSWLLHQSSRHKADENQHPHGQMEGWSSESMGEGPDSADDIPEEILSEMQKRYIDDLYDQPIPVLGNLSPAQAVKRPEMRPLVIEWLEGMEHHYSLGTPIMRRLNTDGLRARLGL